MSGENGALEVQAHGQRIDDLDLLDRGELGPAERALHGQVALEGELRRLGVERLAVVELDVRAQLDRHRLAVVGGLVGQRELRHDVELLVDVEELVAKRREDDAADIGAGERRVEHVGILGKSDAERRLRARRSDGCRERRGREERGGEASSHVPLPVLFLQLCHPGSPKGYPGAIAGDASNATHVPAPAKAANRRSSRGSTRPRPAQYRFPSGSSARNGRPWRGPRRRRRAAAARGG